MTGVSCREVLRWQFELTWSLLELHLGELEQEDFWSEPASHCWTVRPGADGSWIPDWADTEPDPIPVPTIAWISWHIGWWWSVAMDHLQDRTPRERAEIHWPGPDAAVPWLRELRVEWLTILDRLTDSDLRATAPYPWPPDPELTIANLLAWVSSELMKNAAEIGQLRLLRAAG